MALLVGPASTQLGDEVSGLLAVEPVAYEARRFPDGETEMDLQETVRNRDVFVLQSTSPPVDRRLIELLLLADACRRAGAARLTGVIPYFGYARQDRRVDRRSLGARVAADIISTGGFDRVMLIDAHTPSIEGFFAMPIDHLTAVPLLAAAAGDGLHGNVVVVAPDFGAVKRAREYARLLNAPMALVHKTRLSGEQVAAHGVIGDVRNRVPLIVDDMLSTGGTIEAAVGALAGAGALEPMAVAVTHALMVGRAPDILQRLPVAPLIAGNTVAIEKRPDLHVQVASVAPLIATAIRRSHHGESLADLRART